MHKVFLDLVLQSGILVSYSGVKLRCIRIIRLLRPLTGGFGRGSVYASPPAWLSVSLGVKGNGSGQQMPAFSRGPSPIPLHATLVPTSASSETWCIILLKFDAPKEFTQVRKIFTETVDFRCAKPSMNRRKSLR